MDASPYRRMWNSAYVKLLLLELCLQMGMMTAQPVVSNAALALGTLCAVRGLKALKKRGKGGEDVEKR